MIKIIPRQLLLQKYLCKLSVYTNHQNAPFSCCFPKNNFCTSESMKAFSNLISRHISTSNSIPSLFSCMGRFERTMEINHLSELLKKFSQLQKSYPKNLQFENYYNEIVKLTVLKCEMENKISPEITSLLFRLMIDSPYHNIFSKRCQFVIVQKALQCHEEMDNSDFYCFITTLMTLNSKNFTKQLIPNLKKRLAHYSFDECISLFALLIENNIDTPKVILLLSEYLTLNKNSLDSNNLLRVLALYNKYPDSPFPPIENRVIKLAQFCESTRFYQILQSLEEHNKLIMSAEFYSGVEKKFLNNIFKIETKSILHYLTSCCYYGLTYPTVISSIGREILNREDSEGISPSIQIFHLIAQYENINPSYMQMLSNTLLKHQINNLNSKDLKLLIKGFYIYSSVNKRTIDPNLVDALSDFLLHNCTNFSNEELYDIAPSLDFLSDRIKELVFSRLQNDVLKQLEKSENINFENIYRFIQLTIDKFTSKLNDSFLDQILARIHAFVSLELGKTKELRNLENEERIAKIILLFSNHLLKNELVEKRDAINQLLAKLFLDHLETLDEIKDANLLAYIMVFYTSNNKPSPAIQTKLQNSLSRIHCNTIDPVQLKFITEKTDLFIHQQNFGNDSYTPPAIPVE